MAALLLQVRGRSVVSGDQKPLTGPRAWGLLLRKCINTANLTVNTP